MENAADLESQLVESMNNVRTIKSFGMQNFANLKTETKFVNLLTSVYKSGLNSIFSDNASLSLSRSFTVILLWAGAAMVMEQTITAGELMSFYAIIGYFIGPVSSLIGANKTYQNARIAADRLFEIMDLEGTSDEEKQPMSREDIGDIRFQQIKFRYGTRVNVFENFDLTLEKGKLTAIVGESGSGKSTIAGLLKRLYPVEHGRIMVGNYNLYTIREDSLNALIGIVPQQIDLFAGSLLDNIALGEFQPDAQRIIQLADEIGALRFINDLPGGLNAFLEENGLNLSGGQRQRLAILRALYPDPEIIIFDEATSALDIKSEELIVKTMKRLRARGKTVVAITHHMGAAKAADKTILLDNGTLVAEGSHASMIKENERYRMFWNEKTS